MTNFFKPPALPASATNPPSPTPPAPMPDMQSPEAIDARRRAQIAALNRSGRQSTILTAGGQRGTPASPAAAAQGGDYSGARLG